MFHLHLRLSSLKIVLSNDRKKLYEQKCRQVTSASRIRVQKLRADFQSGRSMQQWAVRRRSSFPRSAADVAFAEQRSLPPPGTAMMPIPPRAKIAASSASSFRLGCEHGVSASSVAEGGQDPPGIGAAASAKQVQTRPPEK